MSRYLMLSNSKTSSSTVHTLSENQQKCPKCDKMFLLNLNKFLTILILCPKTNQKIFDLKNRVDV